MGENMLVDEISSGGLFPLADLPDMLNCGIKKSTCSSWVRKGLKNGDDRIKLKSIKIGRRIFTKKEWVEEFLLSIRGEESGTQLDRL